jgi:hypothetical protein
MSLKINSADFSRDNVDNPIIIERSTIINLRSTMKVERIVSFMTHFLFSEIKYALY